MRKVFGTYGEYYDIFYDDKDYEQECDFVQKIFKKYSSSPVKSILDAGCGTGGHSIPLALRGYEVTGIDASPVMIKKARQKAKEAGVNPAFRSLFPTVLLRSVFGIASGGLRSRPKRRLSFAPTD